MPRIQDLEEIRSLLNADRIWAAYALGDLDPQLNEKCEWYANDSSVVLLYKGFDAPLLFVTGDQPGVEYCLQEIEHEPKFYLSIKEDALPTLKKKYDVREEERMMRMHLSSPTLSEIFDRSARLGVEDVSAIRNLFQDGAERNEVPQFFETYMVKNGEFYGIFESGTLVAVAGTHLVVPNESVAAIGCVYTKASHRGQGLSCSATGAVMNALIHRGIKTIVLNVKETNTAAIRVYEKLGFARHCSFYEGTALRRV